jgi:hypothetical protein
VKRAARPERNVIGGLPVREAAVYPPRVWCQFRE